MQHVKEPWVHNPGTIGHHFSPVVPPLAARGLPRVVDARDTWRTKKERLEKRGIVQSATLAAVLPGGEERNWTPIQIIIITYISRQMLLFVLFFQIGEIIQMHT